MTGAELKTLRESLGLTAQWLARACGVKIRTINYWEASNDPIKDDIVNFVRGLEDKINAAVCKAFTSALEQSRTMPDKQMCVHLLRYRADEHLWIFRPDMQGLPATLHAAMLFRICNKLITHGIDYNIVYMDPNEYLAWLDENSAEDSEITRAAWAAIQAAPIQPDPPHKDSRSPGRPVAGEAIDWENVDWSKKNAQIARDLGVTPATVRSQRIKRFGA